MLDAVVIAGSPNSGPLKECSKEPYEALIRMRDKPMVRFVVDALLGSGLVDKIAIAGPSLLKDAFPEENIIVTDVDGQIVDNAVKAISMLDNSKPIMIATCDIPLLTAEAVKDFVRLTGKMDADFYYPICSMEEVELHYPGIKRTSGKLREGTFTGGNLFLVNPAIVSESCKKAQEFVNYRKSPFQLCRLLGLSFVLKLLLNRLTIPELEAKVSEILGINVQAIITTYPEIGIDVDKPSDYHLVSTYLDKLA